jgi:hypothetical protein
VFQVDPNRRRVVAERVDRRPDERVPLRIRPEVARVLDVLAFEAEGGDVVEAVVRPAGVVFDGIVEIEIIRAGSAHVKLDGCNLHPVLAIKDLVHRIFDGRTARSAGVGEVFDEHQALRCDGGGRHQKRKPQRCQDAQFHAYPPFAVDPLRELFECSHYNTRY